MRTLAILFLVCFALAPAVFAQGRFKVTVQVVDGSGNGIAGANVKIANVSGDRKETFSGTSGVNGQVVIHVETIFGGSFEVQVHKPLYHRGTTRFTAAGNSRDKDRTVEVALVEDSQATEVIVHVTDQATNAAISGVSVTLTGRLTNSAYESASTDQNGYARIYLMNKTGSFTVSVSSDLIERAETSLTVGNGARQINVPMPVKKKTAKGRQNATFFAIVKTKDNSGRIVPLQGVSVAILGQKSEAVTDGTGRAELSAEAGIGDEVVIIAAKQGYANQRKVAQMNATTAGGAGGVLSIYGGAEFLLEKIMADTVNLVVEVLDSTTNKPLQGASVRPQVKVPGISNPVVGTDKNGEAPFRPPYALPREAVKEGFRLIVSMDGYEEKWTDVAPELLTGAERRYTVHLTKNLCTAVGRWIQTFSGNTSTWTVYENGRAEEDSLGRAQGTAIFSGKKMTIKWKTGAWEGTYTWMMDGPCRSGSGDVIFSAGPRTGQSEKSTVTHTQ